MGTDETAGQARYSAVAIGLHWLIAAALAFQIGLGFAMPKDASGFAAYQLHKSVGIVILALTAARLAWRLAKRPPQPVEEGWTRVLAQAVHAAFYAVLILAPLSGWLLVSTAPVAVPTVLFGAVPLPHLPAPPEVYSVSETAHELLSWVALALFGLHVAGALRHHFVLHHRLVQRMAPRGSVPAAGMLSVLVVAVGLLTFLALPVEAPTRTAVPSASPARVAVEEQTSAEPAPEATATEDALEEQAAIAEQAPPLWAIQPGGRLAFSVGNGGDTVRGTFSDWSGSIRFDPESPEDAEIAITVNLASASVGDATMDSALTGADFLAAAAHPRATWRASSVRRTGPGRYAAQGALTLRGVSRPQALTFALTGSGLRQSVEGSAQIDRNAFGVGQGPSAESVAGSVRLDFAFEAVGRRP
jgi:cytochrome b561/polyisoprenoid-binding protein YceI